MYRVFFFKIAHLFNECMFIKDPEPHNTYELYIM